MHERGDVDVILFGLFALCLYTTTTGYVCFIVCLCIRICTFWFQMLMQFHFFLTSLITRNFLDNEACQTLCRKSNSI